MSDDHIGLLTEVMDNLITPANDAMVEMTKTGKPIDTMALEPLASEVYTYLDNCKDLQPYIDQAKAAETDPKLYKYLREVDYCIKLNQEMRADVGGRHFFLKSLLPKGNIEPFDQVVTETNE